MRLLDFVRDHVTLFLDDPDVSVRRAAAAAAAKVLHRAASIPPGSHGSITQNQVCPQPPVLAARIRRDLCSFNGST